MTCVRPLTSTTIGVDQLVISLRGRRPGARRRSYSLHARLASRYTAQYARGWLERASRHVPPALLGIGYPRDLMELLVRAVGSGHAKELLLTARAVDAREALRLGLLGKPRPNSSWRGMVSAPSCLVPSP